MTKPIAGLMVVGTAEVQVLRDGEEELFSVIVGNEGSISFAFEGNAPRRIDDLVDQFKGRRVAIILTYVGEGTEDGGRVLSKSMLMTRDN